MTILKFLKFLQNLLSVILNVQDILKLLPYFRKLIIFISILSLSKRDSDFVTEEKINTEKIKNRLTRRHFSL